MSKVSKNYAIGVFDSGLGGLTVVKELSKLLPDEDIVYFGDTAHVPYGTKSKETIVRFSVDNAKVLLKHKVKVIVVACNSSSSYAIPLLKKKFNVPIIGVIRPGAASAIRATKNNRVGVIATSATVSSGKYEKTLKSLKRVSVFQEACPLFVPIVEEGWFNKKIAFDVAGEYVRPLKQNKVDTLILGCTHYPLLKNTLKKVMGKSVYLVDSAKEVALEVKEILTKEKLEKTSKTKQKLKFLVSDKPQQFTKIAKTFLGYEIKAKKLQ